MKTYDLYSRLRAAAHDSSLEDYAVIDSDPELGFLRELARSWDMTQASLREWFSSPAADVMKATAEAYLAEAAQIITKVEAAFGCELPGRLVFMPSFGEFDGFARYDRGEHIVLLGIDFPDANCDYLRALTAHELSHVYRDHAPDVWSHLGKPLAQISRREYLDATDAQEHLVSEGLATLFSQTLFPEIDASIHHYYEFAEWQWCLDHAEEIENSLTRCLSDDADVWSYYAPSRVASGSPSHIQYYWASRTLAKRIQGEADPLRAVVLLHTKPARAFAEFRGVSAP